MKSKLISMTIILCFSFYPAGSAFCEEISTGRLRSAMAEMGICLRGIIEVAAAYQDTETEDTSDITLATVELALDARPVKHVSGHIVFLYEEDDTDPPEIDQGYIRLDGEDKYPFHAEAGRLYLPFGNYESHFISDPLTLTLGETRESALVMGFNVKAVDFFIGLFNGDVNEAGDNDDMIDGFTAGVVYALPAHGGFSLSTGLAYLSNVGDSDGITDQLAAPDSIAEYIPAVAAFMHADWNQKIFCKLSYVGATDSFSAGDLLFDGGRDVQPLAFNAELAYVFTDRLVAAVGYGASHEAGDFLPESLYAAVVSYAVFEHVDLSLEYQTGQFEDGSDITTVTMQLALGF